MSSHTCAFCGEIVETTRTINDREEISNRWREVDGEPVHHACYVQLCGPAISSRSFDRIPYRRRILDPQEPEAVAAAYETATSRRRATLFHNPRR